MTKCKLCNAEESNAMHLFGHHPFLPDTETVELPSEYPTEDELEEYYRKQNPQ